MKKTVTLHFYNEEFLLPWWLKHHKKYFDHGILINYHSTDRSVDIIKEFCPTWDIVTTRNQDFGVAGLDSEIMDIEAGIDGWRVSLSATEFLVGNYSLMDDTPRKQLVFPTVSFIDWHPTGTLKYEKELWEQIRTVITNETDPLFRSARAAHNFPFKYYGYGRHFQKPEVTTNDLAIFHFGNSISSPEMLERRLQIQHKIPVRDKQIGYGHNHYGWMPSPTKLLDESMLLTYYEQNKHKITDVTEFIVKFKL